MSYSDPIQTGPDPVRVVIVDDDPFVVQSLREYLGSAPQIEVLSTFTSAVDALAFLSRVRADVLVTDVRMPGMDGIELLTRVKREMPGTAVVVLTSFDDDAAMLQAFAQHASGFLLKDSSPAEVVNAVLAANSGGTTISPVVASRLVAEHLRPAASAPAPAAGVTEAESAVLALLCEGYTNAEIAEKLVLAASTVKTHVSSLMRKYGVSSRLKLVVAVHRVERSGR